LAAAAASSAFCLSQAVVEPINALHCETRSHSTKAKPTALALLLIAVIAASASGSAWVAQRRAEEARAAAAKEAKLQVLRQSDPKQYLAGLRAANDPRWEVEFKVLDPSGYAAYLTDLKAKQEQERQASIQRLTEQLASTKPDDLEGRYSIYSSLMRLDPGNKGYAADIAAIEPAVLKALRAKFEAEDQLKNPLTYVKLENFSWEKSGFGSVMVANFTLKNELPYAVKDITVACRLTAPSGTEIDSTWQVVYERVEARQSKRLTQVNMGFIHNQSSAAGCRIASIKTD